MFIGHFGAGLAAKRVEPNLSLGTLFLATQFIDLIWPILLLLGIERVAIDPGNTAFTPLDFTHYPISHSFLGVLIWALLFGSIYYAIKKKLLASIILGSLVMSHWILDLVTHRPDLPLAPGSETKVGLGLWNSIIGTMLLEGFIFLGGAYLYLRVTKALNKKGTWSFWALIVFLSIIYLMNTFGSPPPSSEAIGVVGLSMWLLVAWGYWIDRNRQADL